MGGDGTDRMGLERSLGDDVVDGGPGRDRLVLSTSSQVVMTSGAIKAGGVSLGAVGFEEFSITSGGGQDRLTSGTSNDVLAAGSGKDELSGGDGTDLIYGGTGDDLLKDGAGKDALYGGDGNDSLMPGWTPTPCSAATATTGLPSRGRSTGRWSQATPGWTRWCSTWARRTNSPLRR